MKKNFVIFSALVLGAAAGAYAQAQPAGRPAPSGAAPVKIAVINVQLALLETGEGKKAAGELQAKYSPRRSTLEKRQADIQSLQDQLKKGSATMSEEAKAKLVRDIDTQTKSLNRDAEDLNADVETENNRIMQDLGGKMQAVWTQYLTQNGYAILIDVSNQNTPVLWAAEAVNVTPDIIKLYDQAHPVSAGAAPAPAAAKPPAAKPPTPPATKKQ